MFRYSAIDIKFHIDANREVLFASYIVGRPDNWTCDLRTSDLICIAAWLTLELMSIGLSDEDRRTQQWKFNRESRSDLDLFQCAADIMNEALDGKVEQNRKTHYRWG